MPDQERPTSPWFFVAPSLPAALEGEPDQPPAHCELTGRGKGSSGLRLNEVTEP